MRLISSDRKNSFRNTIKYGRMNFNFILKYLQKGIAVGTAVGDLHYGNDYDTKDTGGSCRA